eukprot:jgi/Chrzof1/3756/Cz13g07220.t1
MSGGAAGIPGEATRLDGNLAPEFRIQSAALHGPRRNAYSEIPARFLVPAVGVGFAISWFAYYVNRKLYSTTPKSLTPEFQAEARRIGPVAERVAGPPVFLDPIRHRIPGYIRGPEDLKEA